MTTTATLIFVIGLAIICFLVGVIIHLERQLRDARNEIRAGDLIMKHLEGKLHEANQRIKNMLKMREGVK